MHLLALLFSLGRRSFVAAHGLPYYPHHRMEPEARHRAANEDTMIPALMMSAAMGARTSLGNKVEGSSRCTVRRRSLCAATVKLDERYDEQFYACAAVAGTACAG